MLVHAVYFWLKKDLNAEQRAAFLQGVESLKGIASTESVYVGGPAPTFRPVVDRTYDVALVVLMKDMAAHDAYQVDPLHKAFLEQYASNWEKVVIYDSE